MPADDDDADCRAQASGCAWLRLRNVLTLVDASQIPSNDLTGFDHGEHSERSRAIALWSDVRPFLVEEPETTVVLAADQPNAFDLPATISNDTERSLVVPCSVPTRSL